MCENDQDSDDESEDEDDDIFPCLSATGMNFIFFFKKRIAFLVVN